MQPANQPEHQHPVHGRESAQHANNAPYHALPGMSRNDGCVWCSEQAGRHAGGIVVRGVQSAVDWV